MIIYCILHIYFNIVFHKLKRLLSQYIRGVVSRKGGEYGGWGEKEKKKNSQFPSQNESMKEVLSKAENREVLKNRGEGGNFEEKNANLTNAIQK